MKFIILNTKTMKNFLFIFISILLFSIIIYICIENNNSKANLTDKFLTEEKINKVRNLCQSKEKVAYLTFDDGPSKIVTPKILDILTQNNIKANFFVVGKHVKEHPDIIKQMYENGHFIANHGYSHNNAKLYKNKTSFMNEILNTDKEIAKAIGINSYSSHIFRFPNGSMSPIYINEKKQAFGYLQELDYTYIDWNALNNDSIKKYSNYDLLNNLKKSSKNKGTLVILMHDTGDVNKTYDILQDSINFLVDKGYEFRTFYDLINY